jgi:hypothetical protein
LDALVAGSRATGEHVGTMYGLVRGGEYWEASKQHLGFSLGNASATFIPLGGSYSANQTFGMFGQWIHPEAAERGAASAAFTDTASTAIIGGTGAFGKAPRDVTQQLPIVRFRSRTHPDLAANIWNAQQAGHPRVLTHGGDAAANRAACLEDVPNVRGLSRDEYPFASSKEGGRGAWVGHIPPSQQNSQGGILNNFFRRNNIRPGDKYGVEVD